MSAHEIPWTRFFELLGDHLFDQRYLLFALREDEMTFQAHRPFVIPDQLSTQFLCKRRRRPDCGAQKEVLGLRGGDMPQAGNQTVEPVSPVRVFQHLHFINDDGAHLCQTFTHPQMMVHSFIRADDDIRLHTAPGLLTIARQVNPRNTGQKRDIQKITVTFRETAILLVCKRNKRN